MRRLRLLVLAAAALSVAADRPKAKAPPGPLAVARERLLHGNYAEAEAAFKPLLADPATRVPAAVGTAQARRETGDFDGALKTLADAIAVKADADLHAARADLLYDLGRFDDATAAADTALAASPDHVLARWTKGRVLRDTGDVLGADGAFRAVVRHYTARSNADKDITDPGELTVVALAGAENARRHRLSEQFKFVLNVVVADALKSDPDHWPAEVVAGGMLLEKFNHPDAVEAFEKALKINPKAADALAGKARAAMLQYDLKTADELAGRALRVNPKHPATLRIKADIDLASDDYAAAEKRLLAAKAVNPREPGTLARLCAVYTLQGRQPEADRVAAEAKAFDKLPGAFYADLADALEDRKRYALADGYYQEAAKLRPDLSAARTGLGMLKLRLGDEPAGRKILAEALAGDPFNIRVANTLKVLKHLDGYATKETAHYVLKYDAAKDRVLAEFLAEYLEDAHADLKKQFNYEPPGKTIVELFNSHDMFSGRVVGVPDLHTVGACTGRVFAMASPGAKGVKKPFNWARVVRHELTHIFNINQTDFRCPHWLTEGLAVRSERMPRPLSWSVALKSHFDQDTLFNLDTVLYGFVRPKSDEEWGLAYAQSQLYVDYLTKTHGEAAVGKMLDAYRDGLDNTQALKKACNVDKAAFEAGYRAHVAEVVRTLAPARAAAPKAKTVAELEATVAADPDDNEAAAMLAEAYTKRDNAAGARKLVDRVLNADADHALANVVKARLFERAGDADAASVVLERARKAHPDDPKILLGLGRLYLSEQEFAKAAEVFEHGRKVAPLDGDWLTSLTTIYRQQDMTPELLSVLREVVQGDPDNLDGRLQLAKVSLDDNKPADAERYARECMHIDVNSADAQDALIDALRAQKKDAEADKVMKRVAAE